MSSSDHAAAPAPESTECVDCGSDAEGATCDMCGKPLCVFCNFAYGKAVCLDCDDCLDKPDTND